MMPGASLQISHRCTWSLFVLLWQAPQALQQHSARCRAESAAQQVVVVGQVLASEINIGFEDIVNTQASDRPSNRHQLGAAMP